MGKKSAIVSAACVLLAGGLIATYNLLPKRYLVAERLSQATVFWNDKEAFVFLDLMKTGRSQNIIEEKISSHRAGLLMMLAGFDFSEQQVVAYRLQDSGTLNPVQLPQDTSLYGKWKLVDGNLQFTPTANTYRHASGFRWDGVEFRALTSGTPTVGGTNTNQNLSEDDEDDDARGSIIASRNERAVFRSAGWHWKTISGYSAESGDATLPMTIGSGTFNLLVRTAERKSSPDVFDLFAGRTNSLEISGDTLASNAVLWKSKGWQQITKAEYEQHAQKSGRRPISGSIWIWLAVALLAVGWKMLVWGRAIYRLFTVKKQVLRNVASTYSFPPAVPGQFPQLDTIALERYTREWESLGFERLIDTSPVSDGRNHPATFCRMLVHSRHHCFAQVMQMFPKGKAPMPMRNGLVSYLEEGWSIGSSDRKPLPSGALIRRPKALAVNLPGSSAAELLQSLLSLRQQVCLDLGISPLTDDTVEGYAARAQETAKAIKTAIAQKNFLTGMPQFYYRKLGLMRAKPEYVWLGDYPKAAEQRKKAYESVPVG